MAALIAFFLDFICANEGIIGSACVPLYRSSNCALIADGFFDPASVEKIDAAVRVTDDEMRVWSYGKMRTSYDSVDLIPDYRMDANFRGRQFLGMSSSLEDSNSICRMHHLHSMLAISMQLTCIRVHLCMILPPGLIGEFMVPNQLLHLGIACDRVNQCILVTSRREKWLFLPHRKEVIRIRRV